MHEGVALAGVVVAVLVATGGAGVVEVAGDVGVVGVVGLVGAIGTAGLHANDVRVSGPTVPVCEMLCETCHFTTACEVSEP